MPHDSFGRPINYLRISVIDHCNLRCVYCMPLRGLSFVPSGDLLTADQIETVVRAAAKLGFNKIRLTGGEPLLRSDLLDIVERISRVDGIDDLGMTTNAILLPEQAVPLREAGLSRINIHLDTLDPQNLKRVMRFGTFEQIWAGIEAAERAGFAPIKLNAVVVRDFNEVDVVALARLTIERDWYVRFIELMPLGGGECARLSLAQYVPTPETKARIEVELGPLSELPPTSPSDEARNYRLEGARGVVGFISPVSEPYCGSCSRMRLTADGKFHLCLLNDDELDVRRALLNGGGEEAVSKILLEAVRRKPTGHRLEQGVSTERRAMFQIGG
ncbi:MAG: GTP 3',8-cyclase MoaA [Planctomycetes bacterium]|nr:GTP 3',8-cyclase MoaA [Planctomycetota bacterium]